MTPYFVELYLHKLNREAMQWNPAAIAMRDELARLYDAAGERRPPALGMPCQGVRYTTTVQEWTQERGE